MLKSNQAKNAVTRLDRHKVTHKPAGSSNAFHAENPLKANHPTVKRIDMTDISSPFYF